jgi:hypothetical protein
MSCEFSSANCCHVMPTLLSHDTITYTNHAYLCIYYTIHASCSHKRKHWYMKLYLKRYGNSRSLSLSIFNILLSPFFILFSNRRHQGKKKIYKRSLLFIFHLQICHSMIFTTFLLCLDYPFEAQ